MLELFKRRSPALPVRVRVSDVLNRQVGARGVILVDYRCLTESPLLAGRTAVAAEFLFDNLAPQSFAGVMSDTVRRFGGRTDNLGADASEFALWRLLQTGQAVCVYRNRMLLAEIARRGFNPRLIGQVNAVPDYAGQQLQTFRGALDAEAVAQQVDCTVNDVLSGCGERLLRAEVARGALPEWVIARPEGAVQVRRAS
ncbi:hypothetical protein [Geopseudomonas aromaticivorans]